MKPEANDIVLPPEFSGPAQLLLYTRYGDPREKGWETKWITDWHIRDVFAWFPKETIRIHKHFKDMLESAFHQLVALGLDKEIKTIDDCYILRNHTGRKEVLSVHSWGAGIDMNATDNITGSLGTWSDLFITTMEASKIYCGQRWEGRAEPMHFAMVNG